MRTSSLFLLLAAASRAIPSLAEEASAEATEVSAAGGCRNPEIRREWRTFSSVEKAAYITAVNCLARKPHTSALKPTYPRSNIPSVTTNSSYYDDMTYVHMDLTDQIHYTGLFLPWHRWFVNAHIQQLKAQCGYRGVMPYWDWSQDSLSLNTSGIFSTNSVTGLGGFGDPLNDYQITTGGFSNMTVAYPVKHRIRRQFTPFPYLDWYWLQRPNEAANATITKAYIDAAINGYVGDFVGFQNATEKAQAFHPNIHMILGGDMAGTCPTAAGPSCTGGSTWTSNDPIFFLHHANIDRIWYMWQLKNPANAKAFKGGSVSTYTDPAYPNGYPPWLSTTTVIPTDGMFPSKTIQNMLSTNWDKKCFESSGIDHMRGHKRAGGIVFANVGDWKSLPQRTQPAKSSPPPFPNMLPSAIASQSVTRASLRHQRTNPSAVIPRNTQCRQPHNFPFILPRPSASSEQKQNRSSEESRYKNQGLFSPAAAPRHPPAFRDSTLNPRSSIQTTSTGVSFPHTSPHPFGLPFYNPPEQMSDVALAPLIAGNAKWAAEVREQYPTFFADAAKGQSPKVLWIGCADSRVPESTVLGCKPGEIFVHRNIANQFHPEDDSALAVLTYAVENLGVEHIVIAGHTQCGGAAACHAAAQNISGAASPATTPLARWLNPLTQLAASLASGKTDSHDTSTELSTLVEANVRKQVDNVVDTDVVQRAWASGKQVYVHGWVYMIETGTIKDLKVTANPPAY
ncbi:Di-copper centre-containing protein [Rhizoctonia solani]|uniref:carbonic anhydrase n=1 Tax=Rhizoctonia solani TaxID=456999 RepID=A0A8H7H787_9AGAM|nr:Di-copper centre-containing protein [Rhizoctonia solani]